MVGMPTSLRMRPHWTRLCRCAEDLDLDPGQLSALAEHALAVGAWRTAKFTLEHHVQVLEGRKAAEQGHVLDAAISASQAGLGGIEFDAQDHVVHAAFQLL